MIFLVENQLLTEWLVWVTGRVDEEF